MKRLSMGEDGELIGLATVTGRSRSSAGERNLSTPHFTYQQSQTV